MNRSKNAVGSITINSVYLNFRSFRGLMTADQAKPTPGFSVLPMASEHINQLFEALSEIVRNKKKEFLDGLDSSCDKEVAAAAFDKWVKIKMPSYYAMSQETSATR